MNETLVHPLSLGLTAVLSVALLRVSRSHAIVPFLLAACLIPAAHRLVIAGFDLTMLRLVLLAGLLRVVALGETRGFRPTALDAILIAWVTTGGLVYTLREATLAALVNRLGVGFDVLATYFLFRVCLREPRDLFLALGAVGWVAMLMGATMAVEFSTGRNLFAVLGGVPEVTWVRDGRLRCQGAFPHPIMAGTFGASLAPLLIGYWIARPNRRGFAAAGLIGCTAVAVFSGSSGPLLAYLSGLAAWGLWLVRDYLRPLRWLVAIGAVFVHFVRDRPIWHLIVRLQNVIGGEGYHRYLLIDAFVNNWREWWLLGTESTRHWGWITARDLTNQYILEGVRGGLATLGWLVALLVGCYRTIGQTLGFAATASHLSQPDRLAVAIIAWSLGAALTVHAVSFVSVSYFGQMNQVFIWVVAMIGSLRSAVALQPFESTDPDAVPGGALSPTR